MRSLFGNLKRKLNSDRSWGRCALSLFLAALMLFSTLSSVVFAESYESGTDTSFETLFDVPADTAAPDTAASDTVAPDTVAPDTAAPDTTAPDTTAPDTTAPDTTSPETEPDPAGPVPVEWTVDIDGSEYAVISGVLPEDGSATVEPTAIPRGSETTFSAYDLTVYDGEGEVYAPEDSLAVELHSEKIAETLAEGNSVGVLEKNRYGYLTSAETVSVCGDSVKFLANENSTYYLYANQLVKTLVASDGNTYRITVLYDNGSGFPEDAEIRAEEVSLDSEGYVTYLENTAATLGVDLSALTYNRLFDIAIVDAAGTEYQPNDSVRVTVELMENEAGSVADLRVVHFGGEDDPEELEASTAGNSVTFETNGFSIFSFNDTSLTSRVVNAVFGDRKLYENDDIVLTGRMPLFGTVEATPVSVQIDGRDALIAYDIKIYANSIMKLLGIPWQPSEGAVQVTVKSDVFADADGVLSVYHMQDEQSEPEFVASVDAVDSSVTFEAESFSIYAVNSVIEKTIVAEDGYTYKITVTFDESAGIPADAELSVSEISSADMLRTAAETVGSGVESLSYAKMFDISIVKDGVEYQPNENVKVSVELLDAGEVSDVQVVHFDSETEAAPLAAETDGNTVTFETEGFSVFSFLDFSVFDKVISAVLGETEGVLYENDDIILTGKMPATAVVEANRVDVDIKGKPALIAYDIKIYAHPVMKLLGINWQPTDGAIKVSLKSDALAGKENLRIYHMEDLDSEPEEIGLVHGADSTVEFDAESFSIYPVTDDNERPRIFYTFYNNGSVVAKEYITDIGEFYDPSIIAEYGQTFIGWAYSATETDENNMYSWEQLKTDLTATLAGPFTDGTKINVYAKFHEAYFLRYMIMDGAGNYATLKTDYVRTDADDKTLTVSCDYSEAGEDFQGWIDSATGRTYSNGETITLNDHIDLYAKIAGRYWLVFNANATGATFTGPQLSYVGADGTEHKTIKPDDPTRKGYIFKGWNTEANGNGTWWYNTDGSVNLFGGVLTDDVTLYAQWEGAPNTYTVVYWKQRASDEAGLPNSAKMYDYVESVEITANGSDPVRTGDSVTLPAGYDTKGTTTDENSNYYQTHYGWTDWTDDMTVGADGDTVVNVYYDREVYTLQFQAQGAGDVYTETTGNTTPQYAFINGEWVELTREEAGTTTEYFLTQNQGSTTQYDGRVYDSSHDPVSNPVYPTTYYRRTGTWNYQYYELYWNSREVTTYKWYIPEYVEDYVSSTAMEEEMYGKDGDEYVLLTPVRSESTIYVLTSTLTAGNDYLILSGNSAGAGYALGRNGTYVTTDSVTVNAGNSSSGNAVYVNSGDVDDTSVWTVSGSYRFQNGNYYLQTDNYYNNLQIATGNNGNNTWNWGSTNNRLSQEGYWDTYYLRYNNNNFILSTRASSVYLYQKKTVSSIIGYTYNGQPYDGDRFTKEIVETENKIEYNGTRFTKTTSGGWHTVYVINALYGHDVSGDFPITGTDGVSYAGYVWEPQDSSIYTTGDVPSIESIREENTIFHANRYGTRVTLHMYYYTEVIGNEGPDVTTISHNGKTYVEHQHVTISSDGGVTSTESEDFITIPGFEHDGSDPAYTNGRVSLSQSNNYTIKFYYKRSLHNIDFVSMGAHVTGTSTQTVTGVPYGAKITDYKPSDPTNGMDGYYFDGWYQDQACLVPITDDMTMPDGNAVFYAKWSTYRVRVVLVPGCTDFWFANNQALRFRIDYGEGIEFGNIKPDVAKRPGYKLTGWYLNPDFSGVPVNTDQAYTIMSNTPGVDMHYQETSDWTNNVYGDNDGEHEDVKGILKLYARWQLDVDTSGIYFLYEVEDGYCVFDDALYNQTVVPVDSEAHVLNTSFQIAGPPENYVDGITFRDWMVLTRSGGVSDNTHPAGDHITDFTEERWSNYINTKTIVDDLGNVATMKYVRLRARFTAIENKATTVIFHGNGGMMSGGSDTYTQVVPLNATIDLDVQTAAFNRPHYSLVSWNTKPDGSGTNFDINQRIFANNEGLDPGEANHLYAIWQADIEIVATGPHEEVIYDNHEHSNTKPYTFSITLGGESEIETGEGTTVTVNREYLASLGIIVNISDTGWPVATGTEKGEYVARNLSDAEIASLIDIDDSEYRQNGGKLNIKRVYSPATLKIRDLKLTITKEVTGSFSEPNKPFTFTLVSVDGMTSGSFDTRITRAIEGTTTVTTVAIGGSFWMRDGDTVEIIGLPKDKQVVISEENGYYTTNWKLNNGQLTHGNSMTLTLQDDSTLLVVNRYDPPAPTQIAIKFTPFIIMDIIGLALFALVWTSRKKRRGGDSV